MRARLNKPLVGAYLSICADRWLSHETAARPYQTVRELPPCPIAGVCFVNS